jgi:hypothetical protein
LKNNYTFTEISRASFFRKKNDPELYIKRDNLFLEVNLPAYYQKSFRILGIYWLNSKYYKKEKNVTF